MVATTTKTQNATMPRLGKANLPNRPAVPPHHCEHLLVSLEPAPLVRRGAVTLWLRDARKLMVVP